MNAKIYAAVFTVLSLNAFSDPGIIFRGGLNIASSSFDPAPPSAYEVGSRTGFNAALLMDIPANTSVHVLVGGGFEANGVSLTVAGKTTTDKFNYIVLPLLLSFGSPYRGPSGPVPRFFINVGGIPSFLVSSTSEPESGPSKDLTTVSGFDFALTGEMGAEMPTGVGRAMILGAGYSRGLVNSMDISGSKQEANNYAFKFYVGFKFGRN